MLNQQLLSANIKMYRKAKGISQNAMAKMISVSPQSVSKWECGASAPDLENLCMIAEILEVSLDALLGLGDEQKKVMIGIDGGGTKTEFILFNEDGAILERYTDNACNPNAVGIQASVDLLTGGIRRLLAVNANVCGIYIGSAGFLLGDNVTEIRGRLKKSFPHIKIKCATDMLNVVACVEDTERCISVICGTGSAVLVKEGDTLTRLGGYGYLFDKTGSGYDIGRDALYHTARQIDGLEERTVLSELVRARAGDSVSDLVAKVYKNDQSYTASFAAAVFEAFARGDKIAAAILHENARGLAEIINHAAAHYRCGNKLILSGGIVGGDGVFVKILKAYLDERLQIVIPQCKQAIGTCLLCAEMCGVYSRELKENLIKRYERG